MNKPNFNQKGFGSMVLVLIVIVVALVGVIGWMVYNNHRKPTVTTTTTTSTTQPAATTNNTSAAPVDEKPAIIQAVKDYKDNTKNASAANVTIKDTVGDNAYGSVTFTGMDGGGGWFAHKTDSKWSVVSQGSLGICKDEIQQYNLPASWESTAC